MASRVRQLIGMPSMTCVPEVVTRRPGTCSRKNAPAITERAAFPVHKVTTWQSVISDNPCRRRHYRSGRMLLVPFTLILLRHGQSEWNLKNLFTGWVDVDLTEQGRDEARRGGRDLSS